LCPFPRRVDNPAPARRASLEAWRKRHFPRRFKDSFLVYSGSLQSRLAVDSKAT
jgi:hypothetical protein